MPDAARRGLYDDRLGLYVRAITANASLNAELLALATQASGQSENSP